MRIPDGWFDYSDINQPIENVPIIAFKTPLSERYHRPESCTSEDVFVEKDQEFTPSHLVKKVENAGFELLVVIDLTFTFRYYNGQMELEDEFNIQYDKVKCAGQIVPNDEVVFRVASILNDVMLEHGTESKKLVGIHCTHGVNRTGYIISRYLIEWLNYEPEKAIEAVGKARGYPIEREPFLEDLKKRKPRNQLDELQKLKPKEFHVSEQKEHTGTAWHEWLTTFDGYMRICQVSKPERKKKMIFQLAGNELLKIYNNIYQSGQDYDSVLTDLHVYFQEEPNIRYYRYLFRTMQRRDGEGIESLVTRLYEAARHCDFTSIDDEIMDQIVDKFIDNDLRHQLLRQPGLDLESIVQFYNRYENEKKILIVDPPPPQHVQTNPVLKEKIKKKKKNKKQKKLGKNKDSSKEENNELEDEQQTIVESEQNMNIFWWLFIY